ncbi:unnamed protein product [Microthlaspi erraticum]|uniref:Sacsin/Nov domain-containing protein n=1 Tax=Microthlaspi erraticum TaxID=1685480 RepID=A0A6D2IZX4_9BRAS|nr:unnamed protein product [Microthlaspi erraticum]
MAESAKNHIDRIRRTKFSIGGDANPLTEDLHQAVKNLSAELYAKDVHFLMELIQNAEDNEYPEGVDPALEFVITSEDITATGAPATLLIFNNEKGFSEKNIESVCSVGRSTKKGNRKRGYIGEKGIGFKSVFLITSQPYIFSNGYQIRFNEAPCTHCSLGYIVPEWVEQNPSLADIKRIYGSGSALPTTTIILPLKSDKVKPVKEQLSNVHPEVLLFLSKIKGLSIREHCQDSKLSTVNSIGIVSETNFVTRKSIDAESYTIHLSARGTGSEKECSYYMWKQKFPVKHENRVERRSEVDDWVITLAFPFGERLGRGTNSSPGIYAFLPTEMVTNFPFIMQADFILASSRETILLDDIWNQGILNCVPLAFLNAFTSLVKKTDAPVSSLLPCFSFLPVKESTYAKLNVVRDTVRAKVCAEEIVPSVSHLGQKFFHRPCDVGRLVPAFWDILEKARREGASLQNISSHGIYILDSSFDRPKNDDVLDFLGLKSVSNEWYAKFIQGCDLVKSVSENTYVEVLLFLAENWSRFQSTNMVKVPLIKYVVQKGVTSLSSFSDFSPRMLCFATDKNQAWFLDWNDVFRSMSKFVFIPQATRTALNASSKKETVLNWLQEKVTVARLSISDYAKHLRENLDGDKRLVVAYAHFLHHSISKGFLSEDEAVKICKNMPLVDNYGNINTSRKGVLVPASAGKWVSLVGSNPWRQNSYIELWEEYLSSASFAGVRSNQRELLDFLEEYAQAGDIPDIEPPNSAIPALSGALRKENALLLLEWIKRNRYSLPHKFLDSVQEGSWLRTTMNGSSDYRQPCKSFYHTFSWGDILQNGSVLVDIPLVDRSFYGREIERYKDQLKTCGVMFEFSEACTFVGEHLMSLAGESSLSSANMFSILKFIRYLRQKQLSPADFISAVKDGSWLRTSSGDRFPDGAVLYSQDWKAASLFSDIPFIDRNFYGEANLNGFQEELELLGVVVKFHKNHSLIVAYLNPSKLNYLTSEAMLLVLHCVRHRSPPKLINALRNSQCLLTKSSFKSPAECFISEPEWSCFMTVFDVFPLIDEEFYGRRILSYKEELKQIGVVVQVEEAVKGFVRTFKHKASTSGLTRDTASSLLSCYRKLMGSNHKFPEELLKTFKELQWLHTKLGDFRAPKDCILFEPDWEPLRLVANLPFIDDSSNWYGKGIHEYKIELKSLGVTVTLRQGMSHVVSCLSLPGPSSITSSSALSLLKCVKFLLEDRFEKLPKEFLDKVSVKWLKTHGGCGYRSPDECLLFDKSWGLEPCDGPFIDEEYYGAEVKTFKKELVAIGVGNNAAKACQLLASQVFTHSDYSAITRIYRFLYKYDWKPTKDGDAAASRIWIPKDGKWADASSCVLYDKDKLFGSSQLNVLGHHYECDLLRFFSSAFGVRTYPSIEDYCTLWKDWERTKERLSYDECCAFWRFVAQHCYTVKAEKFLSESFSRLPITAPDCSSKDGGILLSNVSDVFIADDLLLKDLFVDSSVFVWYPTPSIPALSQAKLMEIYRKIGVKEISKCVEMAEAEIITDGEKQEKNNNLIGAGLVRLILGFLSDPSLKIEAEERSRIIQSILSVTVVETPETITTEYTLNLPSKGEKLVAKAKRMIRWEREKGVVYAEKMEKACGKRKVLEYATCFAEVVAKGVLWEREDLIGSLSELVKMAYLVEFDGEALEFLMKSKNLQVYEEDEKLISDAFSLK